MGKTNILAPFEGWFEEHSFLSINTLDAVIQGADYIYICPDSVDKQDILC